MNFSEISILAYDNKSLNAELAPHWFKNVRVIKLMPNSGVNGTDCFKPQCMLYMSKYRGETARNPLKTGN